MIYDLKFQKANLGREFWLKSGMSQYDYVLLLIDNNELFTKKLLNCFQMKLKHNKKQGAVLSVNMEENSDCFVCLQVPPLIITGVLQLYCMYEFTDSLIIGSTAKPYGNRLFNLLTLSGLSQDEIFKQVLFQCR